MISTRRQTWIKTEQMSKVVVALQGFEQKWWHFQCKRAEKKIQKDGF